MEPNWTAEEEQEFREALIRLHETKDEYDEPPSNPIRAGLFLGFVLLLIFIAFFAPPLRGAEVNEGEGGLRPQSANGDQLPPPLTPAARTQAAATPFDAVTLGMAPLEVAGALGLESICEISGRVLTVTWWRDGVWITCVFVDFQCISKSRGQTK